MQGYGYASMPPIEETLASYHSVGEAAAFKTLSLLRVTSRQNGRAYAAAGQAGAALHTMAMVQAYQADLLKDLDFWIQIWISLPQNKLAAVISQSMAVMVATIGFG